MNNFSLLCLVCIAVGVAVNAKVLPANTSNVMAINQHGDMVWADEVSGLPDKCDFSCTDQDVPICANNGQCLQKFSSNCAMSAYNCRHPQKRFNVIENWRCEESWAPLCGVEDRKELNL
ncbi:uncharacterized protein LOC115632799 [Scaptodrosophila lebanonensis]|uniref:Uncharacterized protein LOC115632799 n=1 Tax=Drosophila lebanonensis TaxID=7225 RepID=A0A6J2UBQ2_DROLE|nr:uncharacterized protein LOC115632799 [Scaptodrosophila lebanonensis]